MGSLLKKILFPVFLMMALALTSLSFSGKAQAQAQNKFEDNLSLSLQVRGKFSPADCPTVLQGVKEAEGVHWDMQVTTDVYYAGTNIKAGIITECVTQLAQDPKNPSRLTAVRFAHCQINKGPLKGTLVSMGPMTAMEDPSDNRATGWANSPVIYAKGAFAGKQCDENYRMLATSNFDEALNCSCVISCSDEE